MFNISIILRAQNIFPWAIVDAFDVKYKYRKNNDFDFHKSNMKYLKKNIRK